MMAMNEGSPIMSQPRLFSTTNTSGRKQISRSARYQLSKTVDYVGSPIEGVPLGLEGLYLTDRLSIREEINMDEFIYDAPNKYQVFDNHGRRLFCAVETTGIADRCKSCSCSGLPFTLSVLNFMGQEVFYVKGNTGCCCHSCGCCYGGEVSVGQGEESYGKVSYIMQCLYCAPPKFVVEDKNGETQLTIKADCCSYEMMISRHGKNVGKIAKIWAGLYQERYTHADNYRLSFPKNLNVRLKAVLLGAALLVDFRYFNVNPPHDSQRT